MSGWAKVRGTRRSNGEFAGSDLKLQEVNALIFVEGVCHRRQANPSDCAHVVRLRSEHIEGLAVGGGCRRICYIGARTLE